MKKCPNCGTEFEEGLFCPECGTRVEETPGESGDNYGSPSDSVKEKEELGLETARRKQELELEAVKRKQELEFEAAKRKQELELEAERRKQELELETERKRKEQETEEERRQKEEAERIGKEHRTVRGVTYSSQAEADMASVQHSQLDQWVKELSAEKDMHKRQEMYKSFDTSQITVREVKERLSRLNSKVNAEISKSPMHCRIVGLSSLVTFIFVCVVAALFDVNNPGPMAIVVIGSCWWFVSLIWWIIWKIKIKGGRLSVKSNYNLKDI